MKQIALLSTILLANALAAHATVWYVKAGATGTNAGTSWTNAFTSLQSGIGAASSGDSVWVANGTYKPSLGTGRSASFSLSSGVKMFGGFAGTETALSQRNYATYGTVLSGDIGTTGIHTDDVYNVVKASNVSSTTRIDGFKIIYGYANGGSSSMGGGFYSTGGSPTVTNCLFTDNYATTGGALSHVNGGTATITNCSFSNNTAGNEGGAIYVGGVFISGTANITGCTIAENAAQSGGGCYFYTGIVNMDRCVVSGNTASSYSGAMELVDPALNVYNSLIVGNTASNFALFFQDYLNPEAVTFVNCTIANNRNTTVNGTDHLFHLLTGQTMRNCIIWDNAASLYSIYTGTVSNSLIQGGYASGTAIDTMAPRFINPGLTAAAPFNASGYDYHLAALSHAIDMANSSYLSAIYNLDLGGGPRVVGSKADLGAYEQNYCSSMPTVTPAAPVNLCGSTPVSASASGGTAYLWSNGASTNSLSLTTPGVYKVTATNGSGCRGAGTVIINPQATFVYISGSSKLCPGAANTLIAGGSNIASVLWSTSATTASISVSTTGTYSVSATGYDGCVQTATLNVTAGSVPVPVIVSNGGTLRAGTYTTYQWLLNGVPISGATGNAYTPVADGSYTVTVTNADGCTGTSAAYVLTNVGIEPHSPANGLTLAPNPAREVLHIRQDAATAVLAELYNALGQQVLTMQAAPATEITLPLGGLAAGHYTLRLRRGAEVLHRQVVIAE